MKVKSIELDDEDTPEAVTVRMSLMEAAMIARLFGELNDNDLKARGFVDNDIYNALTGSVFNTFWDGGIDDVIAPRRRA